MGLKFENGMLILHISMTVQNCGSEVAYHGVNGHYSGLTATSIDF